MSELTDEALNSSGEETGRDETADDAEQAIDQVDLIGFDDDDSGDGSDADANNSINEDLNEKNPEGETKPSEDISAKNGRAEKRDRTASGRIQEVLARQKAEQERADAAEAELAKYREAERAAEFEKSQPQPDEDGEYDADDIMNYQQKLADQARRDAVAEIERKLATEREQVVVQGSINEVDAIGNEILRDYPIMDEKSPNFNPKVSEFVRVRAVETIAPLVQQKRFSEIPEVYNRVIREELEIIADAQSSGRNQRTQSLDNLRNSSAIVSANAGTSETDDPEMDGWD